MADDATAWEAITRLIDAQGRDDWVTNLGLRQDAEDWRLVMVAYVQLWSRQGRMIETADDYHLNMTANQLCEPFDLQVTTSPSPASGTASPI